MSEPRRRSFRFLAALLLLLGLPAAAAKSAVPAAPSLQTTVEEFSRWYLHALRADREPLRDEKPTLRKHLMAPLIARREKLAASPDGLDADFFLQAQDYGDDWESNVAVTDARIERGTATVVVILGASGERQRLRIGLTQRGGLWKIRRVEEMRR